jgi:hypothetical protein
MQQTLKLSRRFLEQEKAPLFLFSHGKAKIKETYKESLLAEITREKNINKSIDLLIFFYQKLRKEHWSLFCILSFYIYIT